MYRAGSNRIRWSELVSQYATAQTLKPSVRTPQKNPHAPPIASHPKKSSVDSVQSPLALPQYHPQQVREKPLIEPRDTSPLLIITHRYNTMNGMRRDQKIHPKITQSATPTQTTMPATFSTATVSPCRAIRVNRLALPFRPVEREEKTWF